MKSHHLTTMTGEKTLRTVVSMTILLQTANLWCITRLNLLILETEQGKRLFLLSTIAAKKMQQLQVLKSKRLRVTCVSQLK